MVVWRCSGGDGRVFGRWNGGLSYDERKMEKTVYGAGEK